MKNSDHSTTRILPRPPAPAPALEPIVPAADPARLASEVARLNRRRFLVRSGSLVALVAEAEEIPHLFYEVGRLRETTFRAVGEGTGRRLDLDEFDAYYRHLVLWDEAERAVVGAYRIGETDRIVPRFGSDGLYTATLFDYREPLVWRLVPALELGRSFVRVESQRAYAPLLLLWKAIGSFVASDPRRRLLFGAVSLSREYTPESRALIIAWIEENHFRPCLARFVEPRNPPQLPITTIERAALRGMTIDEVSRRIEALEPDGKGIPVLFRQYRKLGGRFLGFHCDAEFRDSVDGLVLVDLAETDVRLLERFCGIEGAAGILGQHRAPGAASARMGRAEASLDAAL